MKQHKIMIISIFFLIFQLKSENFEVGTLASAGKNWNVEFANDAGKEGYVTISYENGPVIINSILVPSGQRIRIENVDTSKNLVVTFGSKTIFNTMTSAKYGVMPNGKNVFIGIDFANKMMPQGGVFSGMMQKTASGIDNKNNVIQNDLRFISYNI